MIKGKLYAKGSSKQQDALLFVEDNLCKISIEDELMYVEILEDLDVSSRLGNVQRRITLSDGSVFASYENDLIDALFFHKQKINKFLHYLESNIKWVFIATVVSVIFLFSFFKWGIPSISEQIAETLPPKVNELIAGNTLEILDKYVFKESTISKQEQEEIQNHFTAMIGKLNNQTDSVNYKLHFRLWKDGNVSIPNAFALPSGDIIVTDKLIQLSNNEDEINSILLHEIGHVVHKHTLKMVIESSFIAVTAMLIVGDTSGIADMGVGLGSLLVTSAYSRKYEAEADHFAFENMLRVNIDPISFSNIMNRIEVYMKSASKNSEEESLLDYIASHPNTKQRVEIAQHYSECFQHGIIDCKLVKDF